MARERVVLIDGTALIYRAFFAIPSSFSTSDGLPTNATYGFALMFRKLLAGKLPRLGAVVFDAPGGTFREEQYPDYKAQRPSMPGELRPQLDWINRVVQAHDVPILSIPGYEADDVIGTLARLAVEAGHEVRIISGDKDFAQLVSEDVRMIDPMRDIEYDPELVRKKWGVPPGQFVDYLALVGDKVDNIPGVPGIGAKGAAQLLERFGSLEGVLAGTGELKGRQKATLEENAALARACQQLATIDVHVPLERGLDELVFPPVDRAKVNALYQELEFFSLIEGAELTERAPVAEDGGLLADEAALQDLLAGEGPVAVQLAMDGGALCGVALARADGRVGYAPLGEMPGSFGAEAVLEALFADPAVPLVLHDLRVALVRLATLGWAMAGAEHVLALESFLVDPTGLIPHTLDQITRQYLHRTLPRRKELQGSGKSEKRLAELPPEQVAGFFCRRALALAEAAGPVRDKLVEEGQLDNLLTMSIPMARVLARMQEEFAARKQRVEAHIHELAGHPFNPGSTKQLATVLFEELGLPVLKKTKTGYSTAADVLERLAPDHAIAASVLEWRSLAKLINTYTQVLRDALNPSTGRIHTSINQTVGASGRLITSDPDLQRTPIRTPDGKRIRQAFLPKEGWVLISADWSQIELRVLAHFSQDPLLLEAYREGLDIHRRTAGLIFDVAPDAVTPEQRNMGKTVNFATIYGQGATALGQQLGIPRKQAKDMIDTYFSRYAGVKDWVERSVQDAYDKGYVETIAGRSRYVPELSSNNFQERSYGERIAGNTPIQGSAADLCKWAMLAIDRALSAGGYQARMLLQIHDELLFECPPDEVEAVEALVRRCMEQVGDLTVPLVVDIGHGQSWAEAH